MEAEIRSITAVGANLMITNIDDDSTLHDKYWLRVPVVRVGGKEVFEAKMVDPEGEWKKKLARLLRSTA